jgi:tetratricopeptide (TPR) repeat protein
MTMENNPSTTSTLVSPSDQLQQQQPCPPRLPATLRSLQRAMSHRRSTMDLCLSNHNKLKHSSSNSNSNTNQQQPLQQDEYQEAQRRLQRQADDLAKGGELEACISIWEKSLTLAQDNQDTLTSKTELYCTLLTTHMQVVAGCVTDDSDNGTNGDNGSGTGADTTNTDTTNTTEDLQRQAAFHRQAAKRYIHRIKPALVQSSWIIPTKELMQLFMDAQAWELAILVADHLNKDDHQSTHHCNNMVVPILQLATMHFQVASQKLNSLRQGEALQHLQTTCKYLQQDPTADMDMYLQVLQLLAVEYTTQGQYELALEALQEQLRQTKTISRDDDNDNDNSNDDNDNNHSNSNKSLLPKLHCQIATEIYIPLGQLDLALIELESATELGQSNDDPSVQLQLLQTKADVLCRLGNLEDSLEAYQKCLLLVDTGSSSSSTSSSSTTTQSTTQTNNNNSNNSSKTNPAEKAKILYTMGRLCLKLRLLESAISYFDQELEITKAALGHHLSVSRVLHELARVYDEGLGDYPAALLKYKQALNVECHVLSACQKNMLSCAQCNPTTHRACAIHSTLQRDCAQQIRETKKCQGRLHFKLGDFEKALASASASMLEQ